MKNEKKKFNCTSGSPTIREEKRGKKAPQKYEEKI